MKPRAWQYHPALDGVRALAIAQVLALHGARSFVPGAFLGVDLFFVLSGFLITGVLLQDHAEYGRIRLLRFWSRRARRLLPPLAVCLLLCFLLWQGLPQPRPSYAEAALPAALYFANVQAMVDPSKLGVLVHAWSLSLEEQFYALWPLALSLLLLLRRPRALAYVIAFIALSAAWRAHLRDAGSVLASYYSPLSRMDELLVGGALALLPEVSRERLRSVYRAAAWVLIASLPVLWYYLFTELPVLYAGGFTLFALGCAALISVAVDSAPNFLQRALSFRWFVAIGKRSYGLYLFHLPVFQWFEAYRVPDDPVNFVWVSALRLGCTALVAELSYRFIERPLLARAEPRKAAPSRTSLVPPVRAATGADP